MVTATKLSSEWIYKFYRELDKNGVENHALLIEQGGEILFEEYASPYGADMPHTLFPSQNQSLQRQSDLLLKRDFSPSIQEYCRFSPNISIVKAMSGTTFPCARS